MSGSCMAGNLKWVVDSLWARPARPQNARCNPSFLSEHGVADLHHAWYALSMYSKDNLHELMPVEYLRTDEIHSRHPE